MFGALTHLRECDRFFYAVFSASPFPAVQTSTASSGGWQWHISTGLPSRAGKAVWSRPCSHGSSCWCLQSLMRCDASAAHVSGIQACRSPPSLIDPKLVKMPWLSSNSVHFLGTSRSRSFNWPVHLMLASSDPVAFHQAAEGCSAGNTRQPAEVHSAGH